MTMPYAESMMSKEEVEKELRGYLSTHGRRKPGWEEYDFNIKIYRMNIPDIVREIKDWSEAELSDNVDSYMSHFLEGFAQDVKERYGWIGDWYQEGRMGGWLVLVAYEPVMDADGRIPVDVEGLSKRKLSQALAPARKRLRDLREIEGLVDRAKKDLVKDLESPAWWGITPKDWRPKK